jgi:hypothetical protein
MTNSKEMKLGASCMSRDANVVTVRTPSGRVVYCDRLIVEGSTVKILRRDDSHRELMIGVRQLDALCDAGWEFETIMVQARRKPVWEE